MKAVELFVGAGDLRSFTMREFTVIGYWADSLQRFSTYIEATDGDQAEEICLREYPGVMVCAALAGRQQCVETAQYVRDAAGQ